MSNAAKPLNPFVICKAAAGSGKTFTLVKEYLKLAMTVDDPHCQRGSDEFLRRLRRQFRGILAITFTNKAAGEMKGRIMDYLAQMASFGTDAARSPMGQPLLQALNELPCYASHPITPTELQQMASVVHSAVLHHYSDLSVCTIDSFMHRIVRTFAHDLDQPMDFDVVIDHDELVTQAVDGLMALVGTPGNEALTEVLQAFADSRMEEEKSYRVESALSALAEQLFVEGAEHRLEALAKLDVSAFADIHRSLTADNRRFEQEARRCGADMMALLSTVGADEADCAGGKNGYYGFFRGLAAGNIRPLTKTSDDSLRNGKLHSTKCDPGLRDDLADAYSAMRPIYERTLALVGSANEGDGQGLRDYNTRVLILKNLYSMAMLGQLATQLKMLTRENGVVPLAEFNRLINKVVTDEPAPFIYERLGNRYHHFLIDEFQDTSVLQWHNLVPLLENGVSQRQESLVVGDGKQAIYRFRQGDVRQFVSLPRVEGMNLHGASLAAQGNYSQVDLNRNFRTASSVVDFNNRFFSWLLTQAPFADNALAQQIYVGQPDADGKPALWQYLPDREVPVGHVGVSFVDPRDSEAVYETIRQTIVRLVREQGYRLRDIMILGRNKSDLDHVSTYLQSHPEEMPVAVSSNESFFLTRSHAVMAVIAALRLLYDPSDRVAAADLMQRLHLLGLVESPRYDAFLSRGPVDISSLLSDPEGPVFRPAYLSGLGLYDCCEELIRNLRLDGIDNAYLASLLGRVSSFATRRSEGLGAFLEWFSDNTTDPAASGGKQLSVASPENVDAVRLLTIHKAKGLEAPVVICPFFSPSWKPYKLWVDLDDSFKVGGHRLPAAFVELDKKRSSRFDGVRDEEQRLDEVDKLNVLYVALTRPQEQLFIVCPDPAASSTSSEISYPRLIKSFMDEVHPDLGDADFRHVVKQRSVDATPRTRATVDHVAFGQWTTKVAVASPDEHRLDPLQEEKVRFGTYAHALLSTVHHADDVDDALSRFATQYPLSDNERQRLETLVHSVVTHPDTARFFCADYAVKNECDLTDGVLLGRPDRVVFTPDETWVIDFKTGQDLGELHDRQVRRYCDAVAGMGYPAVSGWLLYLLPDIHLRQVC